MGRLLARATARGTLAQVRHVTPVPPRAARGLVARVYAQLVHDFGMTAPPVLLHSPAPEVLAACWTMLRESLLSGGAATRAAKEVVATEVSAANACPYCVDVHQATLRALAAPSDPALAAVASWARTTAIGPAPAGKRQPTAQARLLPVAAERLPGVPEVELMAVAVTFHYLNRMVAVFLGESPLPPGVPRRLREPALRLFGRLMRPSARRTPPPGASLPLLPAAPVPRDLAWTGGGVLAGAFARAAAAIEAGATRSVPAPVRDLLTDRLTTWTTAAPSPEPGRAWVAEATAALPGSLRPAAALALLTALAPYQVDDGIVAAYRRTGADDRALIELTAWASLSAARRAGDRLSAPPARTTTSTTAASAERTDP